MACQANICPSSIESRHTRSLQYQHNSDSSDQAYTIHSRFGVVPSVVSVTRMWRICAHVETFFTVLQTLCGCWHLGAHGLLDRSEINAMASPEAFEVQRLVAHLNHMWSRRPGLRVIPLQCR
jgi:hypothetical protein